MHSERRRLLKLAAAVLVCGPTHLLASPAPRGLISCRGGIEGRHYLTALDAGGVRFDIALPARGHGVAVRPTAGECVVLARRPGRFLIAVSLPDGIVRQRVETPEDRHFCGHAVFDPTGRLLYATENDFEAGRGVVGVYDAADGYRRLGELPSHGIDPHELRFLNDGRTLVVANGGIRTHPDLGRSKLNLDDMDSSLTYVDASDGHLLGAYRAPPDWRQLSIRHIDVAHTDTVCVAMQFEGPANSYPPLVAIHGGGPLELLSAPADTQPSLRNYAGSACWDVSGECFAVSAPKGNLTTFWTCGGGFSGSVAVPDGCGVARGVAPGEFILSGGRGELLCHRVPDRQARPLGWAVPTAARWDNHLAASS